MHQFKITAKNFLLQISDELLIKYWLNCFIKCFSTDENY